MKIDPFGGAKPRLLRRGKEAPLRVNPDQAQAFRPGSRRVHLHCHTKYSGDNYPEPEDLIEQALKVNLNAFAKKVQFLLHCQLFSPKAN
jgi:Fe-S oxidoreductase